MRYYPEDKYGSFTAHAKLPPHLTSYGIKGSDVSYVEGNWGTFAAQSGTFNGYDFEYNFGDTGYPVKLYYQHTRAIVGLFYVLKGEPLLSGADKEDISFLKGKYYLVYFPKGKGVCVLNEGRHSWFTLLIKTAPFFRMSSAVDRLRQVGEEIKNTPDTLHSLGVGHMPRRILHLIGKFRNNLEDSPERELILHGYASELLSLFVRALRREKSGLPQDIGSESIHQFVLQHLDGSVTIASIARAFATNETAVKKIFRKLFGTTVHGYILEQRLIVASQLIETTKDSIYFISMRTGFADSSHFVRKFKQRFGVTPGVLRQGRQNGPRA